MVKVMRSFTLDHEVVEMLSKAENASGLINKLVVEHYNGEDSEDIEVLQNKLREIEIETEANNKRIEHLKDKIIVLQTKDAESKKSTDAKRLIRYRKHLVETKLLPRYRSGEITDQEYFKEINAMRKEVLEAPASFE